MSDTTSGHAASGDPVAVAVADLATRLGIDPGQVTVVSAEEVTWADASLGCPHPDRAYAQVLLAGTRIVLRAGGTIHEYHGRHGRDPFWCPPHRVRPPTGGRDLET